MSKNKEKLIELAKTGKYVFHGTPVVDLKKISPKQARHYNDPKNKMKYILDGDPAVCASPYIEPAIFMAIVNSQNISISHFSGFGKKGEKMNFKISSKEALDQAKEKHGFVYVFSKDNFEPYRRDGDASDGDLEWRCYKEIEPIGVIRVFYEDLPENIAISE